MTAGQRMTIRAHAQHIVMIHRTGRHSPNQSRADIVAGLADFGATDMSSGFVMTV